MENDLDRTCLLGRTEAETVIETTNRYPFTDLEKSLACNTVCTESHKQCALNLRLLDYIPLDVCSIAVLSSLGSALS